MPNIAIVWDFDGTLTPQDSTTKTVEILDATGSKEFWNTVKTLRGDRNRPRWEHVLAMDAPIWMYALSRLAFERRIPLNKDFFLKFIVPNIHLYANAASFLRKVKLLEEHHDLKAADVKIHHFVVTAGLKHLVEQVFPDDLITWTFGCCYRVVAYQGDGTRPESIPTFCMDETAKTRSLFEISKGSFEDKNKSVNARVSDEARWVQFRDMVYVGDGETDIPALSLVRHFGGAGIVVFDRQKSEIEVKQKLKKLRFDKRADLITPASFSAAGELFDFMKSRCVQIARRNRAELSDV